MIIREDTSDARYIYKDSTGTNIVSTDTTSNSGFGQTLVNGTGVSIATYRSIGVNSLPSPGTPSLKVSYR